jgi:hypothetical protein
VNTGTGSGRSVEVDVDSVVGWSEASSVPGYVERIEGVDGQSGGGVSVESAIEAAGITPFHLRV